MTQLPGVAWRLLAAQAHRGERKRSVPRLDYCCCNWVVCYCSYRIIYVREADLSEICFVNLHRLNVCFVTSTKNVTFPLKNADLPKRCLLLLWVAVLVAVVVVSVSALCVCIHITCACICSLR